MIPLLLIGGIALLAGVALYWKKLVAWLGRVAAKIKELLPGSVVEGCRTFCAKISGALKNISKNYTKNKTTGEWEETILRTSVEENEIPKELLAKVKSSQNIEVETSEMLMNQLSK